MFLHPILFQPHPPPHLYLYLYQSKIISFQSIGISNNGISFTTANVIFCLIWNLKKWEEKHFSNRSDQAPIKWYDEIHNSFLVWGCCEANNPMWPDIKATPPHTHTREMQCVCARVFYIIGSRLLILDLIIWQAKNVRLVFPSSRCNKILSFPMSCGKSSD